LALIVKGACITGVAEVFAFALVARRQRGSREMSSVHLHNNDKSMLFLSYNTARIFFQC